MPVTSACAKRGVCPPGRMSVLDLFSYWNRGSSGFYLARRTVGGGCVPARAEKAKKERKLVIRAVDLPVVNDSKRSSAAAQLLFLIVNGTWALAAYLLHVTGVPLRVIVIVVCIGLVLGNLAAYAGVRLAAKLRR